MNEELLQLIETCPALREETSKWRERIFSFCEKYTLSVESFCNLYAKLVAVEFANGELSYAHGDLAINKLATAVELQFPHDKFAGEIYLAFDAGEYSRPDDPMEVIPWQKYTLPLVMKALANAVA